MPPGTIPPRVGSLGIGFGHFDDSGKPVLVG